MSSSGIIKSVNWHITSRCNYSCRFCFTKNLPSGNVDRHRAEEILTILYNTGIEKINFVGGEPLLHPELSSLCKMSKNIGYTVAITTNGSLLDGKKIEVLRACVDWIGLSVDSGNDETERKLGRGTGRHVTHCINISDRIHEAGIHLKLNTTLTRLNYMEDMRPILHTLNPDRWKIFQYLPISGQNDASADDLSITAEQYQEFRHLHENVVLWNGEFPVFERCEDMVGSYFMLNPRGNILINDGKVYSEIPFETAIKQGIDTIINTEKYHNRGAVYDWKHAPHSDENTGFRRIP